MAYPYFQTQYQNPYQQQYYQPTVQNQSYMMQQSNPMNPMQSSIIWVSGDKEAAMYPIAPNNAVTLWSQSEPVVYLKQADASGKPTMKIYDLVERSEAASGAFSSQSAPSVSYATKSDIDALRGEIDSLRSDVYGIAGKRRVAKKAEDEE